jgi:hypothetical protein
MKKNIIIKDFDNFKSVNEKIGDQTFFGFATGQLGDQLEDSIEESIIIKLMEYIGINPETDNRVSQFIKEVFVRTISNMTPKEKDDVLWGRILLSDTDYWTDLLSVSIREELLTNGPTAGEIISWMGLEKDKFLGRMMMNAYRETFTDQATIKQMLLAVWNLATETEFIPHKDANQIYKEAYAKLTPAQKEKAKGSAWEASMNQSDILKRKVR